MRPSVLALAVALAACGPKVLWTGHTADRRAQVDVLEHNGATFVVVDGHRRAGYRGIAVRSLQLAGPHIAYAAQVGPHWKVVVDERHDRVPGPPFDSIGEIVLADTGRVAYAAERAGRWHVVVDGVAGPACDAILARTLRIENGRVLYGAQRAGRDHLVVDGAFGPAFDGIGQIVTTKDHVAYVGRLGTTVRAIVDGVAHPTWSGITKLTLTTTTAYTAYDGERWHVVVGARPIAAAMSIHRLAQRADGAHVAWIGVTGAGRALYVDTAPVTLTPSARSDAFAFRPSPAAELGLAFVERTEGGEHVVVDTVAGPTFDEVRAPIWSETGALAYAARRGPVWFVVHAGLEHGHATEISDPVFAADGRLAYVRRTARSSSRSETARITTVVVDGREFPFDLAFEDTLVLGPRGTWAIAAGDVARRTIFISINGTRRIDVPSREIYATALNSTTTDQLRIWTQRELARTR